MKNLFCPFCAGTLVKHGAENVQVCSACGKVMLTMVLRTMQGTELDTMRKKVKMNEGFPEVLKRIDWLKGKNGE